MSFPASGESPKTLFVKKEALHSISLGNSEAACINRLEKSSLSPGGGNTALVAGFTGTGKNGNGAAELERSPAGWGEEKTSTPDVDGNTDDRGGWGKGTPQWKKVRQKRGWKGGKMQKKRSSLVDDCDEALPDHVPNKKRPDSKLVRKVTQPSSVYVQPDQRVRGTGRSSQQTPLEHS